MNPALILPLSALMDGQQWGSWFMEKEAENRRPRTSLIAAKRGKKMLAPVLFQANTNALWFNEWFEHHLLKELNPSSTIILDNAAFHQKSKVRMIAENAGHFVLFLPPYSPDFNPIENDFAIIKNSGPIVIKTLDQLEPL